MNSSFGVSIARWAMRRHVREQLGAAALAPDEATASMRTPAERRTSAAPDNLRTRGLPRMPPAVGTLRPIDHPLSHQDTCTLEEPLEERELAQSLNAQQEVLRTRWRIVERRA